MPLSPTKRTIGLFLVLLLVFAAIFLIAFVGLQKKQALIGFGFSAEVEDWLIMILCIASIIKIVWELYTIRIVRQSRETF